MSGVTSCIFESGLVIKAMNLFMRLFNLGCFSDMCILVAMRIDAVALCVISLILSYLHLVRTGYLFALQCLLNSKYLSGTEIVRWSVKTPLSLRNRTLRRILLSKGTIVTPRRIQMSFQGQLKVSEVIDAMAELCQQGFGILQQPIGHAKNKFFQKADPDSVDPSLLMIHHITPDQYRRSYRDCPKSRADLTRSGMLQDGGIQY